MKTAILIGASDDNLRLLMELAEKLGIKTKVLREKDAEDLTMIYAIEERKTGEYIDANAFVNQLRQ